MGDWIPLVEYASKKGVSLSTLRRHIKANKVDYKIENGRYLLLDRADANLSASSSLTPSQAPTPAAATPVAQAPAVRASQPIVSQSQIQPSQGKGGEESAKLQLRVKQLETDLKKAREEVAELKTLIAFYEEQLPHQRFDN